MYYLKKVQNHYSVTFIRNKAEETNVINHTQRKMIDFQKPSQRGL